MTPRSARPGTSETRIGSSRHSSLLEDPRVRTWYDGRALRSRLSAEVYLRQLGATCRRLNLTPAEVAEMAGKLPDRLENLLIGYASQLKGEGRLDSYVAKTFDGLRSWLRSRHVSFDSFPRLSPIRGVTLESERVPTPEELRRVLDRMTPRGRVIALFMAHTGVRPGVLGSYGAADGLTLADLPDLKLTARPEFATLPFVVRVPGRLSKTRRAYTTFGTQELASALGAYLDERIGHGEKLGPKSPVVVASSRGAGQSWATHAGGFLTTKAIVKEIRVAMSASVPDGVTWRPYVCRSYCSTRLMLAEGSGKISRDLREAILGHDGGVAARYNVGKRWGEDLLREARAAYARAAPYLETNSTPSSHDEAVAKALRLLALAKGVPPEKLEGFDLSGKTEGEIVDFMRKVGISATTPEPPQEEAVPVEEVPARVRAGWRAAGPYSSAWVLLRAPPTAAVSPSGANA